MVFKATASKYTLSRHPSIPRYKQGLRFLATAAALVSAPRLAYGDEAGNPYAIYFISSFGSNELMQYNEDTGTFLGVLFDVPAPVASQIGYGGDLFLSASGSGDVLRFDGYTGVYKGVFIRSGEGGLTSPTAPNFGPDNLVYVGDLTTNTMLRYDADGNFIDVFADPETSGLNQPFMQTFDDTSLYLASGGTDSVLRWDLATKKFLGAFVAPGSGGLVKPIGLEFGPDGNLYAGSAGTNAVLRYDGKSGAFIDEFVPPNEGGISDPHAIRFGGPNSNLYVVSTGNNQVVEFDRLTGAFIRVVADGSADGLTAARGLTFSPRPIFNVYASVVNPPGQGGGHHGFAQVSIDYRLKDYSDDAPSSELVSIVSSDESVDIAKAVREACFGEADYDFYLSLHNSTGVEQRYTITYRASNSHGLDTVATTEVKVPPH